MGHVFAEIDLSNPRQIDLESLKVKALADTGALMLCIPEHVALQLNLETESMREVDMTPAVKLYCRNFFKRLFFHGFSSIF